MGTNCFTDALFYYQYMVIPTLLTLAIALSLGLCSCGTCGRRWCRPPPFPSWLGIFASYYVLFVVGVGLGVHRYWSHKSYTATRTLKNLLAFLSLAVGQGGPLDWAYVHRLHHRLCEHELDFHSPHPRGFWYAQAAWMITPHEHVVRTKDLEAELCADIVNDPDLELFRWVMDDKAINKAIYGMVVPGFTFGITHFVVSALRDYCGRRGGPDRRRATFCELVAGGYCCACYYFYLPVALTWMSTGFVNSATHLWGDAPFADSMLASCTSKNNAFLFFPMLGENWHNNHHAVPSSLSTWVLWYQIDFIYLTGRVFEMLGLASDLRVEVPQTLIEAHRPPAGFLEAVAPLWLLWAAIFAAVWRVRKAAWRMRADVDERDVEEDDRSGVRSGLLRARMSA